MMRQRSKKIELKDSDVSSLPFVDPIKFPTGSLSNSHEFQVLTNTNTKLLSLKQEGIPNCKYRVFIFND